MLIAARVLAAISSSMPDPVAMSIIRNVFEDPREQAQAISVWGAMMGISMSLGPVVSRPSSIQSAGARCSWSTLPVGLLAITLTALYVPIGRAPAPA